MMPRIETQLRHAFRTLDAEAREEAIQESIVDCWVAFWRLAKQRRLHLAFPTALAAYSVRRYWSGRRNGARLNINDVTSPYAQVRNRIRVESLDHYLPATGEWLSAIIEDRRAAIPDAVALRLDVPAWLATLSGRDRQIVELLGDGHRAVHVASRLGLSNGRVSQIRRDLLASWHRFHGIEDMVKSA